VICFIHYKNNDTFAEINCEKRMVMSWEKTIFGCLIGGYALLGLLGGNYAYEQEVKALHVYADSVFHEAFHVELQKRGMDQVESWRYGCGRTLSSLQWIQPSKKLLYRTSTVRIVFGLMQ